MSYDIYGNPLRRGHCEVHPHVHQEYPCDLCLSQRSPKQREPDWPMCGICGEHEACADSCGVAVCSEACDHEARRRHNESEALRARIAELEAENKTRADLNDSYLLDMAQLRAELAAARARLAALEDEKNTYIDYVGDALGQDHDGESLWDAAQRVLSERDKLRAELAAARVDAERYRWLRAAHPNTAAIYWNIGHDWIGLRFEQLDTAIDEGRGEA